MRASWLERIRRLAATPWLAEVVALLGVILYTILVWGYAHTRQSNLDEGAYVYKGYLFVSGQYTPYQEYGPWSNHLPLAFLIPGWIQALFGPGLRPARYFAVFVAVLMLIGLWAAVRNITRGSGNRWWAAAAVWMLATNPFLMKTYSIAVTQGIIACLVIWSLVCVLGEKRPLWQIILGAALAAAAVMTRINLLPVLPLVILYIFWQHGVKAGLAATLSGGLVFIGIHAYYWPAIMQMWARFSDILPFLNNWRVSIGDSPMAWQPDPSFPSRVLSFLRGIMGQFTALAGVLVALVCWPRKDKWENPSNMRAALFLLVLFIILLLMHFWAALIKSYCVSCFAGYVAFFSEIGLLILILTAAIWKQQMPVWYQALIAILVLMIFAGIGLGSFEMLGGQLTDFSLPHWLAGSAGAEAVSLGAVLTNKFGIDDKILRRILPIGLGAGVGLLTLGVAWILYRYTRRLPVAKERKTAYGYWALVAMLVVGTLLTPTPLVSGAVFAYDCTGDVIASYEAVGKRLVESIPPGSSVYWDGGLSVIPLLYLPKIKIYPAQINGDYSFRLGESPAPFDQYGMWNQRLAKQWAKEADFILVEAGNYSGWLKLFIQAGEYRELRPTPPTAPCRGDSQIRIFRKIGP